ncbi:hypothetical protein ACIQ6K_28885 [Streptomyces sp. NPDC096354]|uniref:hypothetical protein n=1 Tax=Streptomyces sp. NPDC096354 TaxID=3366088 RepID=UPI003829F50B
MTKSHDQRRSVSAAGRASPDPAVDRWSLSTRSRSAPIGCVGITPTEIQIRAEDGTTVPQGSRGEICARGFWQRSACQS